jgi:hypothetical protein
MPHGAPVLAAHATELSTELTHWQPTPQGAPKHPDTASQTPGGLHTPVAPLQNVPVSQQESWPFCPGHGCVPVGQQIPNGPAQKVPLPQQITSVGPNGPCLMQTWLKFPSHSLQAARHAVFACAFNVEQPTSQLFGLVWAFASCRCLAL